MHVSGALAGLRVLDLSFYAPGRWATMILADLGADVLCVERPRAPREVAYETFDSDTHVRWFYYQRNKRSITLNLKSAEGMDAFRRIVRTVDVVVESFRPGAAACRILLSQWIWPDRTVPGVDRTRAELSRLVRRARDESNPRAGTSHIVSDPW